MVVTRGSRNGGDRGRGKIEVEKEITGNSMSNPNPNPNPRRSSRILKKAKKPRKFQEDEAQSFCLSASDQLSPSSQQPFQISQPAPSQPAPGNPPFNILQYCYSRREVTKPPTRTPRRAEPESRHSDRQLEVDHQSASCTQGAPRTMNMTEIVEQMDDDLGDIDSLSGCEPDLVSVEGYRVKPRYAEILKAIISKHGDIGANCSLKSVAFCSLSLELICSIVVELKESGSISRIAEDSIVEMQASIYDMEKQNIDVGWLKIRVEEILEAKRAIPILRKCSSVKMLRAECKAKAKALREQLSIYLKDIQALQDRVIATEQEISRVQSEAVEADLIIANNRAKLEHMYKLGTLIDDLV